MPLTVRNHMQELPDLFEADHQDTAVGNRISAASICATGIALYLSRKLD